MLRHAQFFPAGSENGTPRSLATAYHMHTKQQQPNVAGVATFLLPLRGGRMMDIRYHTCGHMLHVLHMANHWGMQPVLFDSTMPHDQPITACPRCGAPLTPASLHEQPTGPAATLAAWQEAWPTLEAQIEALIRLHEARDPAWYPYHVETAVPALGTALAHLVGIVTDLEADMAKREPAS